MKVKDLINKIESFAPMELAFEYDNSGLNVGNTDAEISGIMLTLDVTVDCVKKAVDCGANLIMSHHPITFSPIKNILRGDMISEVIMLAIKNNINLYSCHTNMDNAPKGINYTLAKLLGGAGVSALSDDCGVVTNVQPINYTDLCDKVRESIDSAAIGYGKDKIVSKIAIISGSGGRDSNLPAICRNLGVDVYISAEFKHNLINEFNHYGVNVIECSHYKSEIIFIEIMKNLLKGIENLKLTEYHSELFNNKI